MQKFSVYARNNKALRGVSSVKLTVLRHFLNITLALAPLALALAPPWANPSLGDALALTLAPPWASPSLDDVASSPSPNPSPRRSP